ncbi:ferredoxin [Eubacteriales bacterium OttesenSCG-928-M02]|nr:ferredoxin [Eubacteriales bacterium OttesenSCG-928-M02]
MTVDIEKSGCIRCGVCVDTCPEVFRFGEDQRAEPYTNPVPGTHEDHVKQAADSCPTAVIYIGE